MSLKIFHVVFILLSILLTIGFGIWGVMQSSGSYLFLGIISFIIAILLVFYLARIVRKFRQVDSSQR